jgi:hypothetical protein
MRAHKLPDIAHRPLANQLSSLKNAPSAGRRSAWRRHNFQRRESFAHAVKHGFTGGIEQQSADPRAFRHAGQAPVGQVQALDQQR